MRIRNSVKCVCVVMPFLFLTACATNRVNTTAAQQYSSQSAMLNVDYENRLPQHIATSEKTIVIDPRVHAWGAYNASGNLVRAGLTTAGSSWCNDIGRSCRTKVGTFRIYSLGGPGCKSGKYPLPRGGAPMPYCMFFNGGQALHGSNHVIEGNASHGCVRLRVNDAEWIRYNFATVGTKVIVKPY